MYRHIVLFKIKEEYKKEIPQLVEAFYGMFGRIEGVTDLKAGADILGSNRSFDLGLVVDFDSKEAFDAYPTHPVHMPVKTHMHEVYEKSVSCDFEF